MWREGETLGEGGIGFRVQLTAGVQETEGRVGDKEFSPKNLLQYVRSYVKGQPNLGGLENIHT